MTFIPIIVLSVAVLLMGFSLLVAWPIIGKLRSRIEVLERKTSDITDPGVKL